MRFALLLTAMCLASPCEGQSVIAAMLARDLQDTAVLHTLTYDQMRTPPPDENEKFLAGIEISIQNIFRDGRYEPDSIQPIKECSGKAYLFLPSKHLPKPKPGVDGIGGAFNAVLNNLHGILCIDPETSGLIWFTAELPGGMWLRPFGTPVTRLYGLSISYGQQFKFGAWVPSSIVVDTAYWLFGNQERHTEIDYANYRPKTVPSN